MAYEVTQIPTMKPFLGIALLSPSGGFFFQSHDDDEPIYRMPTSKYIATISNTTSWGGAIELGILAAHYRTEIASVDVETGRIDHFAPGESGGAMRCILIYSGIHYDAASLAPVADAPNEWHQTLFPVVSHSLNDQNENRRLTPILLLRTLPTIQIQSLSPPKSWLLYCEERRRSQILLLLISNVKLVLSCLRPIRCLPGSLSFFFRIADKA